MKVEIKTDIIELRKGDSALYYLSITPETSLSNIKAEIIPTAEKYPDMSIKPDIESITISNDLFYTAEIQDNGIFEIDIPKINPNEQIEISFTAQALNNFDKNTTAVIVTSDNNGSTYEAYAQTTVNGYSFPTIVPVVCSLIFILASALLLRHILKRII